MLDLSGRVLLRQDVQLAVGVNDIGWSDVGQHRLAPGLYIVQLITAKGRTTVKVIVR